jgi:hypothetical protein
MWLSVDHKSNICSHSRPRGAEQIGGKPTAPCSSAAVGAQSPVFLSVRATLAARRSLNTRVSAPEPFGWGSYGLGPGRGLGCAHEPGRRCWFFAGPASGVAGHAGVLCAFSRGSYGSDLVVAGRMGNGMNTALVGVGLGRVLGPKAACLAEVFCAGQLKKVGGAAVEGRCSPARSWPAARRRLAANGGEEQVAHGAPVVLTVRPRARCGGSDSGGDHQFWRRR